MKARDQMALGDGFDKNVAEKMPKIKKLDDPVPVDADLGPQSSVEELRPPLPETKSSPDLPPPERKTAFQPLPQGTDREPLDVLKLLEDLHSQVLASGRVKRALEMDLASSQKTIHQLALDNKQLRVDIEEGRKQLQRVKEIQTESLYLKEENEDALERIRQFQEERRATNETLVALTRERDEARDRLRLIESQIEQNELLKIKEKMKQKEASHLSEENREIRVRLEEALLRNEETEKRYETLRKSFDEVKESLSLLRESCKASYYNLSDDSE
jgi:hypothetical protein